MKQFNFIHILFYFSNFNLQFGKLQNQFQQNKTVTLGMQVQDSFPVFNLEVECEFTSSDSKFEDPRKEIALNSVFIEENNITIFSTIGKRKANLDTFSFIKKDDLTLMGVFDGHGDEKVADYLKEHALRRIMEHQLLQSDSQKAIKQVLSKIEEQVVQMFQKGSTVLIVLVSCNKIIAANIGDCKLFGLRKSDSQLVTLTKQHDLSNQQEMAQIMAKGGLIFKRGSAYRINGQLNISRCIGDPKHKQYMSAEPDFYQFQKAEFKKLILATDGFHRHQLFENEMCRKSLKQIENKARKGSIGYGFDDNATVICFKIKQKQPSIFTEIKLCQQV